MAQEIVNLGNQPNDGTGDSIRDAFSKVNNNFNEVYSDIAVIQTFIGTNTTIADSIAEIQGFSSVIANFSATQVLFQADLDSLTTSGGYTGSAGAGYTGSIGYAGSRGYAGSIGYAGSAGAGYTGSAGSPGTPGGYTGSAGYDGSIGSSGYTGSAGLTPNFSAVGEHILPATDVTYDLGSPTAKFRSLYISTSTIFIGTSTISISETGQMLVNGNDAVSKLEYFGGEGSGPRDAAWIAWDTSTFTFNIPGKELLTAIYDLKAGSKIRAVNPIASLDQEFTIVGNARQYTRANEYLMAAVDVVETTSTNVFAHSLYLPVKDKTATLANGTWTLTLSALGGIVFPDSTVQTTAYAGASISWSVTAGGGYYVFSGPGIESGNTTAPALYLYRGFTYEFNVNAATHPFYIQTASGNYSSGSVYNAGVTNNGTQSGTITFTVPMNAPSTLYYVCSVHSGMGNTINIV